MAIFRTSTYDDDTEQTVFATACFVKAIIITPAKTDATNHFLQLWNLTNPDPGTDAPDAVIPIRGTGATALSSIEKPIKVIFPNRGLHFDTACTMLVTTTSTGQTAPAAGDDPVVEIHYAPIA